MTLIGSMRQLEGSVESLRDEYRERSRELRLVANSFREITVLSYVILIAVLVGICLCGAMIAIFSRAA